MNYQLVISEKPSVAQAIAKVLGANKRQDGYLEGNGYLVSWCVGHLVELAMPESYDEKYSKWRYDDLPILPDKWKYQVSTATRKQFNILKTLMKRDDVEELVNACDSGREGELIFRLVYHQCGCKKPFQRLWISSMEDSAIREGFAHLKTGKEYDALYEAALCRERADWIVGMNATRLFSCLYGQTLNVGRVMTPTLAMVVMRDADIAAFKPEPFYTVHLQLQDFVVSSPRIKEKHEAENLHAACQANAVAVVTKTERKEKSEKPPALYDLTSLQRECDTIFNHTGLYEYKHGKMLMHLKFCFESIPNEPTPAAMLRYYRQRKRLTTRQLAENVGIVPATVLMYERGRFPIPYQIAVAFADILEIDSNLLFDEFARFMDYPYSNRLREVRKVYGLNQTVFAEKAKAHLQKV